jgi:Spy/CpxP family protein refolding chaperone
MKKTMKVVVAGLAIISVGTLAACKSHHSGHDPKKLKEHVEACLKKVGATDEQRLKIGVVTDKIIADGSDLCKNSQGLGKKMADCFLLDKPNKEWLHQTVDEKANEMKAFAHRTVDSLIEISGMLTTEQRNKLRNSYDAAHGKK